MVMFIVLMMFMVIMPPWIRPWIRIAWIVKTRVRPGIIARVITRVVRTMGSVGRRPNVHPSSLRCKRGESHGDRQKRDQAKFPNIFFPSFV